MSLRKSSNKRKGSKSVVLPKPNARRRWTPAPSRVGLDLITLWTGRMDMSAPFLGWGPHASGPVSLTRGECSTFEERGKFEIRISKSETNEEEIRRGKFEIKKVRLRRRYKEERIERSTFSAGHSMFRQRGKRI